MTWSQTEVVPGLVLSDPFMIASSHWTESEVALKRLAPLSPAAVTLKTTSEAVGGPGIRFASSRERHQVLNSLRSPIGWYSDGPKGLEFWNLATTYTMLSVARGILPNTKLGLSVLFGEDFQAVKNALPIQDVDYLELNLKYAFRAASVSGRDEAVARVLSGIDRFFSVFAGKPALVKMPAEVLEVIAGPVLLPIRERIASYGGGMIVANSKKVRVPPSRSGARDLSELSRGVVMGDYLLMSTFTALRELLEARETDKCEVPLVASGGVTDIGATIDVLVAGAGAVQLCSALDLRTANFLEWMREQLISLGDGFPSLVSYVNTLRETPALWFDAARRATSLQAPDEVISLTVVRRSRDVEAAIAETLRDELDTEPSAAFSTGAIEAVRDASSYQFIITKANIASYLLSQGCVRALEFSPLEFDDRTRFHINSLRGDFRWDFAIAPESAVKFVLNEVPSGGAFPIPHVLGPVGASHVDILGDSREALSDLETLYYFAGLSSNAAMTRFLLSPAAPSIKPVAEAVEASQLLPLLRAWRRHSGIMARRPLGVLYSLLAQADTAAHWNRIWTSQEPLLLVCRANLVGTVDGDHAIEQVKRALTATRTRALKAPGKYAKELVTGGFLAHCARLLGATGVV